MHPYLQFILHGDNGKLPAIPGRPLVEGKSERAMAFIESHRQTTSPIGTFLFEFI